MERLKNVAPLQSYFFRLYSVLGILLPRECPKSLPVPLAVTVGSGALRVSWLDGVVIGFLVALVVVVAVVVVVVVVVTGCLGALGVVGASGSSGESVLSLAGGVTEV